MTNKVCVVIPIYHDEPKESEILSIESVCSKLKGIKKYFACPNNMNTRWYKENYTDFEIKNYSKWTNTIQSYSDLLMMPEFYQEFNDYEYLLICQTDALVLGTADELNEFCDMDFDYYGAPWEPWLSEGGREIPKYIIPKWQKNKLIYKLAKVRRCQVGNGGFSLRKVKSMIRILEEHPIHRRTWGYNEDLFFAYYNQGELNIAPTKVAAKFAKEDNIKQAYENGSLPFGVHAWEKDWKEAAEILL